MNQEEMEILRKASSVLAKKAPAHIVEYFQDYCANILRAMEAYNAIKEQSNTLPNLLKGEHEIQQAAQQPDPIQEIQQVAQPQMQNPQARVSQFQSESPFQYSQQQTYPQQSQQSLSEGKLGGMMR